MQAKFRHLTRTCFRAAHTRKYVTCVSTASCTDNHPSHRVLIPQKLLETGVISRDQLIECHTEVAEDVLKRYHEPNYVHRVLNSQLDDKEKRRIGYKEWNEFAIRRARVIVQASIDASMHVVSGATDPPVAVVLAGGTHHAAYDYGSGYCVFNDIIVAGEYMKDENLISNYIVIDLDVHQGDGTAQMAQNKSHVYTFSMHSGKNFPMRKQNSSWDIALDDDTSDDEYLSVLANSLQQLKEWRAADALQFDMIYYQAGVDIFMRDRLGRLKVTSEGIRKRDELVAQFAKECAVPMVVTLGGGYPNGDQYTLHDAVDLHIQTVAQLQNVFQSKRD